MEKYESLSVVGEGSYGLVLKCRHRETGQIVAIKKFIETEDDQTVRKMALREVRMLKKLHHENLVNLIEVFRRKRRFYLVFEFMDHTILDELEENPNGLGEETARTHLFQIIRGIAYCHNNNVIHRDIKPENVLVSRLGVIKLCDFGFARNIAPMGEANTEYVATRWYRAPELLVGDTLYGSKVDIWAIGCLLAEMMSGDPLFPGESDIDQLYQIVKALGKLSYRHQQLLARNPMMKGLRRICDEGIRTLYKLFPHWPHLALELASMCLKLDPSQRSTASDLLEHNYFHHDGFTDRFLPELHTRIALEREGNPLLRRWQHHQQQQQQQQQQIQNQPNRRPPPIQTSFTFNRRRGGSVLEPECWKFRGPIENAFLKPAMTKTFSTLTNVPTNIGVTLHRRRASDGQNVDEDESVTSTQQITVISRLKPEDSPRDLDTTPSPAPFQSLQTTPFFHNSTQEVLHPSINNLNFTINKETSRSPQQNSKINHLSTLTLNNNIIGTTNLGHGRKLERGTIALELETPSNGGGSHSPNGDKWLNGRRLGQPRPLELSLTNTPWKNNNRTITDEFSLPNLPGATFSPSKLTKKKIFGKQNLGVVEASSPVRFASLVGSYNSVPESYVCSMLPKLSKAPRKLPSNDETYGHTGPTSKRTYQCLTNVE